MHVTGGLRRRSTAARAGTWRLVARYRAALGLVTPCLAALCLAALCLAGCSSAAPDPTASGSARVSSDPPSTPDVVLTPQTTPTTSSTPSTSAPSTSAATGRLTATAGQLTRQGLWWAVDSVEPISAESLANVHHWYRGSPQPVLWGRYLNGAFRLRPGELAFARSHHIGVYLIVPDLDCSICDGGADVCGNDHTAAQADHDARLAVQAAVSEHIPAHATLFKDIEQIGSCYGELSPDYLLAWWRYVRGTRYRPGFYGNTNEQHYDFPRAYCAAKRRDPRFTQGVPLAQDEPEPQIDPDRGEIGPSNAPAFAPYYPHCISKSAVNIWQYAESGRSANVTDADEVRPGTPGILAPDGTVT